MNILNKLITGAALLGLTLTTAQATLPTYRTFSAAGNAASPSTVFLPADPNSQIRVVSAWYQADTNNAALQFSQGNGAYFETASNLATTSITNWVNSTNGLIVGNVLLCQQGGLAYTNTLASVGAISATNSYGVSTNAYFITLGTGGWGGYITPYADIYQMTAAVSITVGNTTNALNGDAIFVANYGRPVLVKLTPALATNQIISLTSHYDSQSQ